MKNLFDKFVNFSIDIIHRGIVAYRERKSYKSENELDLSRFTLTFEDHFDGDELDPGVWTHFRQGARKGGYWDRGQAFLKDSNLIIRAEYKKDGIYGAGHRYKNVAVAKANDPYREYNTYGLEWNEDGYIFYVNGKETGRSNFGGVSAVPEYLLLSVEIDGVAGKPFPGWSGKITRNAPGTFPVDFIVDYVRVYQYNSLSERSAGQD